MKKHLYIYMFFFIYLNKLYINICIVCKYLLKKKKKFLSNQLFYTFFNIYYYYYSMI